MAWQLVSEVIRRGPELRALSWGTDSRGARTMPHTAFLALLVIAEGCHESTLTGRVARAVIAGALGTSQRTASKVIAELCHDDHQLVEQVQRGHLVPIYENGRRVGQRKQATMYRLTLAAVGGVQGDSPREALMPSRGAGPPPGEAPGGSRGAGAPGEAAGPSRGVERSAEHLVKSAEHHVKFSGAPREAPGGSHIPVGSPGDSPGGEPASPDLSDEPPQPCGRRHDPETPCRLCGEARRADEQRVADVAAAEAAERAEAARRRRECPRCDPSGWIEDPHTGAPLGRCDHQSEPSEAADPPDRRRPQERDDRDPYAYECPKCQAPPGELCRQGGKRSATLAEPHDRRVRFATGRAA